MHFTKKEGMAGRFVGITLTGFVNGLASYGLSSAGFGNANERTNWQQIGTRSFIAVAGFANFWILDYSFNHDIIYGSYYGGSNEYYKLEGNGYKIGIGTVKTIFTWLILSD